MNNPIQNILNFRKCNDGGSYVECTFQSFCITALVMSKFLLESTHTPPITAVTMNLSVAGGVA